MRQGPTLRQEHRASAHINSAARFVIYLAPHDSLQQQLNVHIVPGKRVAPKQLLDGLELPTAVTGEDVIVLEVSAWHASPRHSCFQLGLGCSQL